MERNTRMSYIIQQAIGSVYSSQGDASARNGVLFRRPWTSGEKCWREHPDVALSYNNIGSVYDSQGDYAHAMEYHQKALGIRIKVFGERNTQMSPESYNNIG